MKRFIESEDRSQITLFPDRLEDYVTGDNPVRVVDAFVDQLDLFGLGFRRVDPSVTGRPGYHPSVLLKLHIYGYLNRVQSSRRLEREAARNVEVMWLGWTSCPARVRAGHIDRRPRYSFCPSRLPTTTPEIVVLTVSITTCSYWLIGRFASDRNLPGPRRGGFSTCGRRHAIAASPHGRPVIRRLDPHPS